MLPKSWGQFIKPFMLVIYDCSLINCNCDMYRLPDNLFFHDCNLLVQLKSLLNCLLYSAVGYSSNLLLTMLMYIFILKIHMSAKIIKTYSPKLRL
jgi:hypothetical protein